MTSKSAIQVPGIDLSFRPKSYFWPMGLETHLLSRIKGAERRAAAEGLIKAGRVDEVFDFMAKSALDDDERKAFGGIHPRFMGGEYLPDLAENEVEIARITIQSTLQDVTSVFARRGKRRIRYQVVDEYEGETLCDKAERTSTRPLTLVQAGAVGWIAGLADALPGESVRLFDLATAGRVGEARALYDLFLPLLRARHGAEVRPAHQARAAGDGPRLRAGPPSAAAPRRRRARGGAPHHPRRPDCAKIALT